MDMACAGRELIPFLVSPKGVIFSLRFSEDERSLLSASDDRSIRLWPLPCDWKTLDGCV